MTDLTTASIPAVLGQLLTSFTKLSGFAAEAISLLNAAPSATSIAALISDLENLASQIEAAVAAHKAQSASTQAG